MTTTIPAMFATSQTSLRQDKLCNIALTRVHPTQEGVSYT